MDLFEYQARDLFELTQQVREMAAAGMDEKSREFRDQGGAIYLKRER